MRSQFVANNVQQIMGVPCFEDARPHLEKMGFAIVNAPEYSFREGYGYYEVELPDGWTQKYYSGTSSCVAYVDTEGVERFCNYSNRDQEWMEIQPFNFWEVEWEKFKKGETDCWYFPASLITVNGKQIKDYRPETTYKGLGFEVLGRWGKWLKIKPIDGWKIEFSPESTLFKEGHYHRKMLFTSVNNRWIPDMIIFEDEQAS